MTVFCPVSMLTVTKVELQLVRSGMIYVSPYLSLNDRFSLLCSRNRQSRTRHRYPKDRRVG